ncbi:hypothetical protein [Kitasatospora purpeofusca]|uniref:hypothetical protein n=1 Tax=Kitasatospora purpeofusca TaxID=67352 RepID=UPI003F4A9944
MDRVLAERVMDQALAFLGACAANPDARLSPARLVDVGWHTFILHTAEYRSFCRSLAGRSCTMCRPTVRRPPAGE